MTMAKIKSFVRQAMAAIQGDDAKITAEKIYRVAQPTLKSQISLLEGTRVDFEEKIENAKEALDLARVNGGAKIENRDLYIKNLLNAHNTLVQAEEASEAHENKIKFYQEQLAELDKEEDEPVQG